MSTVLSPSNVVKMSGVGPQRGETIDAHVARAAAALAADLDGADGVPTGCGLHPGGEGFKLAPLAGGGVFIARDPVEAVDELGLREVERVRRRQQRHQPPLVGAVIKD